MKIFISYRRDDTAAAAGRLYDRLSSHLGKDQVFMDVDTIHPGERFADVVKHTADHCDVLLALIGDRWLTTRDAEGNLRLQNPQDWVRLELRTAFDRNIVVIPVLFDHAAIPRSVDLPADLQDLTLRQAIHITHAQFHADVDRLLRALVRALPPAPAAPGARRIAPATDTPRRDPEWARSALRTLRGLVLAANVPLTSMGTDADSTMTRLAICFGFVLVVWNARNWRVLLNGWNLAFVALSAACGNLALWIGERAASSLGLSGGDASFWIAIISGAICLAAAQRLLLHCTTRQAVMAAVTAPLATFLAIAILRDPSGPLGKLLADHLPLFWQMGYLLGIHFLGAPRPGQRARKLRAGSPAA